MREGFSVGRLALPFRGWVQRFSLALLVAAAVGLMVLGKAETRFVERFRVAIIDMAAPVLDVLSRPVDSVADLISGGRDLLALHSENLRLKDENARLRHWYEVARGLEQQNASFRDLLNYIADPRPAFITARVIGDSGGAFVRTVLLNAGSGHGVRDGQAVVNGEGLVGRVVETGHRSARVLLVTDLNARVPVVVESTRATAILAGDNTARPRLTFLPVGARVSPGDRIVTSGHGGMLPPGLAVGVVVAVEEGVIRVQTFVDWPTLEYVRVLDYALPGVLPSTRTAGRAGPLR